MIVVVAAVTDLFEIVCCFLVVGLLAAFLVCLLFAAYLLFVRSMPHDVPGAFNLTAVVCLLIVVGVCCLLCFVFCCVALASSSERV